MPHRSWTPLHARLHRTLRERSLLAQGQALLVAVSGGQDSLCLLQLLLDLQPKWSWQVAIAHCNHHWRTDADANAAYVEQLAQSWQVPYYSATATKISSSEAAARNWRYEALAEIALAQGCSVVVAGHTLSDRAETTLYNLIRGSGINGLQALTWQRELTGGVRLVRPLLNVTRAETSQFCQERQLKVWEDCTNQDWRYARNRIRQDLIPYLQTHFNPQVEVTLAQTAELLRADVDYLEQQTEALWQQAIDPQAPTAIRRSVLQAAPLALQRRVIRHWLQQVLPTAPNFDHIEKLVALIAAPNRTQSDPLPGGAIAQVKAGLIWLQPPDDR
ncbi:tRNA lysidine(34) synthetase TilS [Phormidium tenue FACHB-886]|nr:tRNA lysidine(34) synthetase TilS [Phormidium tenue FACHB-886]